MLSSSERVEVDIELVARLRLAVGRLSRRLRQEGDTGLTPSAFSALATVDKSGPLTLGELAGIERVQPPTVTRIVVGLEEAGLLDRETDPKDRRVCRVRVTDKGRRLLQKSRTRKTVFLAERLGELSESQRTRLADAVALLEDLIS